MDHRFSAEDLSRLLNIAEAVTSRHGCSVAQAITLIERAVEQVPSCRPSLGTFAERLRVLRSRRNAVLGVDWLREPAWDMLLDLVAAREEGRAMTTTALCYGSGAPPSTALRHVERLAHAKMIERQGTDDDQRRTIVSLAPDSSKAMDKLVAMFRDTL